MDSLWKQTAVMPEFERLEGSVTADVLVIGGGMAGLLCARKLIDAGADCVLLEADRICSGVTGNTTAKITSLHGIRCAQIIHKYGMQKAQMYYQANQRAVEEYARMCEEIECDFIRQNAYIYSTRNRGLVEKETRALNSIGIRAELHDNLPLPFEASAVCVRRQGQFHPLKFAAAVARGLRIYEHSRVNRVKDTTARTQHGSVSAKSIIFATHFPFVDRHGSYFLKQYQQRSYVIALSGATDIRGMYLDENPAGLSIRSHGELLLIGGGGHRTGDKSDGWKPIEEAAARLFPGSKTVARWAAQDCMTLDGIPYIGRYSALTPDWYVATGFNKWGMTSSMVAADLLTALLSGAERAWTQLFSPSRSMMHRQLPANVAHAVKELLSPTVPRCPHLGCALKWNPHERSWDCPCHGSRFEESGKLLNGPSNQDATVGK